MRDEGIAGRWVYGFKRIAAGSFPASIDPVVTSQLVFHLEKFHAEAQRTERTKTLILTNLH
jgi:hypothetical protein